MSIRKLRILLLRLVSIPLIFLAVFVRPRWPVGSGTAFFVEFAGYLFLLAGLIIRIWSIFYIGGRKSHQLVTEGPYSICRNPLYVGNIILVIGVGLCFESIPLLAAAFLVLIPVHIVATRLEERHLESKFPAEYPKYREKVPRFWPRLRNYQTQDTVAVSVRAIRRIAVDCAGVLILPEVEDLLEVLHQRGVIPVLWHFP